MRVALLSDLHLERHAPPTIDRSAFDVLVAAGDIGQGFLGLDWLVSLDVDVVYVLGNHEFWDCDDLVAHVDAVKKRARGSRVRVLDDDAVLIGDVRFLGSTLWVDYGGLPARMRASYYGMNDFARIGAPSIRTRWASDARKSRQLARLDAKLGLEPWSDAPDRVHPAYLLELHRRSRRWLSRQLAKPFDGRTVVVSHHAPTHDSLIAWGFSPKSLRPDHRWGMSDVTAAIVASYASANLWPLLHRYAHRIDAWCHGHTHQRASMSVHGTPVYCNAATVEPIVFDVQEDSGYAPLAQAGREALTALRAVRSEFDGFARRLTQALESDDRTLQRALVEALQTRAARFDAVLEAHVRNAEAALGASAWALDERLPFARLGRPFQAVQVSGHLDRALRELDAVDARSQLLARQVLRARLRISRAVRQLRLLPHAVKLQRRAIQRALRSVQERASASGVDLGIRWSNRRRLMADARPEILVPSENAREHVETWVEKALHPNGPPRDLWLNIMLADEGNDRSIPITRVERAAGLYQEDTVSLSAAARHAGMSLDAYMEDPSRRGVLRLHGIEESLAFDRHPDVVTVARDVVKTRHRRCARCSWVHYAISEEEARRVYANPLAVMNCSRCGAPGSDFEQCPESDVPYGAAIGPIVDPAM